jgi:hypothetical protein
VERVTSSQPPAAESRDSPRELEKSDPDTGEPDTGEPEQRSSAGEASTLIITKVHALAETLARTKRIRIAVPQVLAGEAVGRAFGRLTVLPVICMIAWLLTGLPLLLAGEFLPVPVLLISAPLATAIAVNVLARTPGWWPSGLPGKAMDRGWMPWFGLLGSGFAAGGFTGWQLAKNSSSVIATRTPGAYFQTGYWIAQHGSLPIPGSLAAFGGAHPGLHLSSIGFFASGHSVVPAVSSGLPMLLAGGFWTSGVIGGTYLGPVLGGLAIFTFAGLVGRLAGRQWAPAGALVLAATAPELYTSRDAFSEPAVQVLLFGGLCLVLDALTVSTGKSPAELFKAAVLPAEPRAEPRAESPAEPRAESPAEPPAGPPAGPNLNGAGRVDGRAGRWRSAASWRELPSRVAAAVLAEPLLAGIGGLALGLTSLLTLGSLAYLIPVIAVAGILVVARRKIGVAFCAGLVIGCGYGLTAGYVLARPFADSVSSILRVIALDAGGVTAATVVVILWLRAASVRKVMRKILARPPLRWLPGLGSLVVIAALGFLIARPYIPSLTVRGTFSPAEADYVAYLQHLAHLQVDPTRLYSEDTLYWVIWYAGLATVLLGGFGATLLVRRCVRALITWRDDSAAPLNWALPVAIVLGGSAAVLWQPFTIPDQPWASRRLVPVVIPGLILLAIWAAAWLTRRAKDRGAGLLTAFFVSLLCIAAMAVPAVATSFGIGLTHSGTGGGLRPSTGGLAQRAVGTGQIAAVRDLCSAIGKNSSVVILDRRVAADFTQVIRGMCNVPVAWMPQASQASSVDAVLSGIAKAGRRPVLLGARPVEVSGFGGSPTLVMNLATTQDPHVLTQAPGAPWPVRYVIWMAVDDSPAVGI